MGQHVGLGGPGERVEHLARVGQLRARPERAAGAGPPARRRRGRLPVRRGGHQHPVARPGRAGRASRPAWRAPRAGPAPATAASTSGPPSGEDRRRAASAGPAAAAPPAARAARGTAARAASWPSRCSRSPIHRSPRSVSSASSSTSVAPSDGPSSRSVGGPASSAPSASVIRARPPSTRTITRRPPKPTCSHQPSPRGERARRGRGGGRRVVGERLAVRGRVGAAQQPVVLAALAAGADEHEAAAGPLAVHRDDDLARVPLLGLVGAGVPDRHRAAAVLAGRDLAGELQVLHRVVLGAHGQPDRLRVGGQALRHRPGRQHAVALQAHVPVQPAGVVFLDHEPVAGDRAPGRPPGWARGCAAGRACGGTRRAARARLGLRQCEGPDCRRGLPRIGACASPTGDVSIGLLLRRSGCVRVHLRGCDR